MNANMTIWGTTKSVDAFSVAYAVATGDMATALELTTGTAATEAEEKQFAGEGMADDEWASL